MSAQESVKEQAKVTMQEIKVKSSELVEKVKELIEEGNTRRIIIKKDDQVYLEVPLTWGVGGAIAALWLSPVLAAIGALAALVSDVTIVIEREAPYEEVESRTLEEATSEDTAATSGESKEEDASSGA